MCVLKPLTNDDFKMVRAIFVTWKLTKLCMKLELCSFLFLTSKQRTNSLTICSWPATTCVLPSLWSNCTYALRSIPTPSDLLNWAFSCITRSTFKLQKWHTPFEYLWKRGLRSHKCKIGNFNYSHSFFPKQARNQQFGHLELARHHLRPSFTLIWLHLCTVQHTHTLQIF